MENRKQLIEEIMANLNALKHRMLGRAAQKGKKQRITHSQWFVLNIIEANKNVGTVDISKILSITPSAATQLVDGLVKNGYVQRKTNSADRRFFQLCVSKKGQKNMVEVKKQHIKTMEILFKALSDAELKQYLKLQQKILNNILN